MKIFSKKEILQALDMQNVLRCIEEGFVIYSQNESVIPPVGMLYFDDPPGDCHIKYGYAKKGRYYVVKIASAFQNNLRLGKPVNNGLVLLFDKETGEPMSLLQDEGYLTDLRTAAAGCVAAKYLAPKQVTCIGIVGTGVQAALQLKLLQYATECRKVLVWGRDKAKARKFCEDPELKAFQISVANDLNELTASCNLIVTTTSSRSPLLFAEQIRKGTHITAVGADDFGKQELDSQIFARADRIVVDSRSQCSQFGDVSHALKGGVVEEGQMVELGEVILDHALRRTSDDQVTVVDLTGVAIQDLQIAQEAFSFLGSRSDMSRCIM